MANDETHEIGLVSCVSEKRDEPTVPRELYTTPYFRKMRDYAEQEHDEWCILSAEHGLLDPDGVPIEPYDRTLRDASALERPDWADSVVELMREEGLLEGQTKFVIHAGIDYYDELAPRLEDIDGINIEIPTEGLRIGEKLAWYSERI